VQGLSLSVSSALRGRRRGRKSRKKKRRKMWELKLLNK
jgi:hypothetical protein